LINNDGEEVEKLKDMNSFDADHFVEVRSDKEENKSNYGSYHETHR
jgi:hypothetical protein